jgi:molybdopterin-containing oxidoreductase family iron-sulfur binding subunit
MSLLSRRRFLKILGATGGGAAALSSCGVDADSSQKLIPYLVPPEDQIPGIATYYASTCRECPAGCGIHVRTREGRAVKIEGNPSSPINRGALCSRGQAGLQGLYNPDRVRTPLRRNAAGALEAVSWDDALALLGERVKNAGRGRIAFVTGHEASSFGDLVDEWTRELGGRHVTYEPFGFEALREGNRLAFGTEAIPAYDFANARHIISFGADFLDTWLSPVAFQAGFTRAHAFASGRRAPAKFTYVGPRVSLTGMNADQWLAVVPGTEGLLALSLAHAILEHRLGHPPADASRLAAALEPFAPNQVAATIGIEAEAIEALAQEFGASGGGLAVAGGMAAHYPNGAGIVAAANLLSYVAGAVGQTIRFGADLEPGTGSYRDIIQFGADLDASRVAVLLSRGANPLHSLPAAFAQSWAKAAFKVSFTTTLDETSGAADLVLPDLHPLEQWNDARPQAGVMSLLQPVMQPVFPDARHAGDVLLEVAEKSDTFLDYLKGKWQAVHRRQPGGKAFDRFWEDALQAGGVFADAPNRPTRLGPDAARVPAAAAPQQLAGAADDLALVVFPHPALHDGRGADKQWLQELPDPVSKITWHAWVEMHPDDAANRGVASGDVVRLATPAGEVSAPVWVTSSIRRGVLAVPTGQGHAAYGRYAAGRSFNAFTLLPAEATTWGGRVFAARARVATTREHRRLASTEGSPRAHGAGSVELLTVAQAAALKAGDHPFHHEEVPSYAQAASEAWAEEQHKKASLGDYAGLHPRWALAVDLTKCTGCGACVTACYAENNLASVGEELVTRGREMAWLRIERYWRPDEHGQPQGAVNSPMMCQQCGNAPCEPVCPVYAAYHTPDGLNGQVYNRCVGTRYCANNCPYKVRYFNWYNFAERGGAWDSWPEPLHLLLNPDVTVREKGVMEKCTFCVQRIRGAQNQARLEDRTVRDGEITTACAQSCPSEAIVFGDLNDPSSRVHALAEDPRAYHVLAGLNTKPGVNYLARVVHGEAQAPAEPGAH